MSITMTKKAIFEVKKVMKEQNLSLEENVLEVGVAGGGCSGFSYRLGFKKKSEIDPLNSTILKLDGLEAVVDNKSLPYMEGTTVDYKDGLNKRGFAFENPQASRGCGCGQSFNV